MAVGAPGVPQAVLANSEKAWENMLSQLLIPPPRFQAPSLPCYTKTEGCEDQCKGEAHPKNTDQRYSVTLQTTGLHKSRAFHFLPLAGIQGILYRLSLQS